MSTRAYRILEAIAARLNAVAVGVDAVPLAQIYIGREDLEADDVNSFPCASVIEVGESTLESQRDRQRAELDVDVVMITRSNPDAPLAAGHELWEAGMKALFPTAADYGTGTDRLGGLARSISYNGRAIAPREDGGITTSVLINLRVEYLLHVTNPSQ